MINRTLRRNFGVEPAQPAWVLVIQILHDWEDRVREIVVTLQRASEDLNFTESVVRGLRP